MVKKKSDSVTAETFCASPSSSSSDHLGNIAAAYYNSAFDIVGKLPQTDSRASRPSSADDEDSAESGELKRIKSRREAARMQYQRILCERDKFMRSSEEEEITSTADSGKWCGSRNVPSEVFPSSLKPTSRAHSPLSHDAGLTTSEGPRNLNEVIRMEEIAVDEDGADFETILGENIEIDYEEHNIVANELDTHLKPDLDDSSLNIDNVPSFAQEHSIFAQAILQLLTERDQHSTRVSGSDDQNMTILKSGTLKKISHRLIGVWKNKFVEVRTGSLSYYEYVGDNDYYTQVKSIPLRAASCKCKIIEPPMFAVGGAYVFELSGSGPKRFWMANSAVERNEWVSAITSAIISSDENEKKSDEIPTPPQGDKSRRAGKKYKPKPKASLAPPAPSDDRQIYLQVQKMCQKASSKEEYIRALSKIDGKTLNVPVHWVKEKIASMSSDGNECAFKEEAIDINVDQFWKDMLRDTVSINEKVLSGDLLHGPEKIVGCLTRSILDLDRIATKQEAKQIRAGANHTNRFCIKESEAVFYARDLLLSSNRTKSGGHSYYCTSTLCNNPNLVVVVPNSSEAEPLRITLRHTAPIEDEGDKIWKNEESLLSEQLKINIVTSCSQNEKAQKPSKLVFPRIVLPILRRLRIPYNNLSDDTTANVNTTKSKDSIKDTKSNFTTLFRTAEEKNLDDINSRKRATVEVLVYVSSEYRICTTDPSGDVFDDTWCLVKALFLQNFYIGGGPDGGIQIGDARIQFCISCC